MSQQLGLQSNEAGFRLHVAVATKRYEIVQIVGLQVGLVFAGNVTEGTKRGNVVNVYILAQMSG